MTRERTDGLYLMLMGSAVFLLLGTALAIYSSHPISDFRFVYNSARCLQQHVDPYKQAEFLRVFQADGGDLGSGSLRSEYLEMAQHMYLPTSFIIAPFALFPWTLAIVLWTILIALTFIIASFLTWDLGAKSAPILSGFLVCVILASSELLIVIGNAAGIAVSLCIVSVWCFIQERFVWAGVFCLAISLMLKPHDAAFIWLYFLLAGGVYRRYALQALIAVVGLSAPLLVWITVVAPQWLPELRSNLASLSAHGHLNDPGPASMAGHGMAMVIDLQSVISIYRDDPRIYNPVSYLICGVLLLVWSVSTLRSRSTPTITWFALASIAALSMLPVYHRMGDAKLLLLTIPACAILWAEGGLVGWLALGVTAGGILLTGELQWAIFLAILNHMHISLPWLSGNLLVAVQVFPVPLMLLVVSIFYLWVYVRRASGNALDRERKL